MGDIADMHVEAYAAGLDPNEMDGADWADFLADEEEGEREPYDGDEISSDLRVYITPEILRAAHDGEAFQATVLRLWPQLTKEQAAQFETILDAINGFTLED